MAGGLPHPDNYVVPQFYSRCLLHQSHLVHDANHLRQMFRHRTRSLTSVLDQDASIDSGPDNDDEQPESSIMEGLAGLDTAQDTSISASVFTLDTDGFSTSCTWGLVEILWTGRIGLGG
mmetsp:Transcript_9227/g.8843  ORF Transcript_9227/g.8843 Transcript_9227/m.8843 type:complete len:119 (-) Transcript_9227:347-703(-)